jgi:hypothetical protein
MTVHARTWGRGFHVLRPVPVSGRAALLSGAAWVLLAVIAGPAFAGRLFLSQLDGSQEVPPVPSPGTGTAETYLNSDQTSARIKVRVQGLENTIVAAHIHIGPRGTSGPMLFDLGAFTDSLEKDSGPIGEAAREALLAGNLYVNVHTDVYLNGEIRGQLDPAACVSFLAQLDGAQEVPPNGSPGTGRADFTLWGDRSRLHLDLAVQGLTSPITGSHLHRAPPGVNGPVVHDIGPFMTRIVRDLVPSGQDVDDLLAGLFYVNVHTSAFPGGEIRGQVGENMPAAVGLMASLPNGRIEAWPNPSVGMVGLRLALDRPPSGLLAVVDVQGRVVRTIEVGPEAVATWDGRDAAGCPVAAGTYFARIPLASGAAVSGPIVRSR